MIFATMQNIRMPYEFFDTFHEPERTEAATLMHQLCQKDFKEGGKRFRKWSFQV